MSITLRIMYLRNSKKFPMACIAIALDRPNGAISYQYSVFNPEDHFDKRMARELALGRLISRPVKITDQDSEINFNQISWAVMEHLSQSKTAPTRAVRAAKRWLKTPKTTNKTSSTPEGKLSDLAEACF
jgi:hypothetical protein